MHLRASIARWRALVQPAIDALLPSRQDAVKPKVTISLQARTAQGHWLIAFGYVFHTLTFYFVLKFAVQIVADAGFTQPEAASTLTWANVGGAIGGLLFGFLLKKWDIKGPTIGAMLLGVGAVAYFGMGHDTLNGWRVATFLTMFFLNAAIVGFYAAFARGFPAYARATGTGFALGIGRAGAAGSPILAGFLFVALGNENLQTVSIIMGIGCVIGAVLLALVPLRDADQVQEAG